MRFSTKGNARNKTNYTLKRKRQAPKERQRRQLRQTIPANRVKRKQIRGSGFPKTGRHSKVNRVEIKRITKHLSTNLITAIKQKQTTTYSPNCGQWPVNKKARMKRKSPTTNYKQQRQQSAPHTNQITARSVTSLMKVLMLSQQDKSKHDSTDSCLFVGTPMLISHLHTQ